MCSSRAFKLKNSAFKVLVWSRGRLVTLQTLTISMQSAKFYNNIISNISRESYRGFLFSPQNLMTKFQLRMGVVRLRDCCIPNRLMV